MTTQNDLLREHQQSYRGFIRVSIMAAVGVVVVLGLLALFTL